jgi:hypothetical protein
MTQTPLTLIEARREAVALTLLCQTNGIWTDRLARIPNLDMAARVMAENPFLAEAIHADADQLIAAYEGASA